MPKPWDDPEEKLNKKLRKIGRNAAYGIGGAIGIFLIATLYPKEEGAETQTMIEVMNDFSLVMFVYAAILLGGLIFQRKRAPLINMLMTWFIIPSWIVVLVLEHTGR